MWVDYQLFYREDLFLRSIGFIDGLLPQVYREAVDVVAEKMLRRRYFRDAKRTKDTTAAARDDFFFKSHLSKQCAAVITQQGEMREPPQRKRWSKIAAIHGCDSTAAKEPFTILLVLCSDLSPHDSSAETRRMSSEKSKRGETRPRRTLIYLCPVFLSVWGLWRRRSSDQKAALHKTLTFVAQSRAYRWEQHTVPSRFFFLCGRSTMASRSGQDC